MGFFPPKFIYWVYFFSKNHPLRGGVKGAYVSKEVLCLHQGWMHVVFRHALGIGATDLNVNVLGSIQKKWSVAHTWTLGACGLKVNAWGRFKGNVTLPTNLECQWPWSIWRWMTPNLVQNKWFVAVKYWFHVHGFARGKRLDLNSVELLCHQQI